MIMKVCAIYDKKIGAYMMPQFFRTKGEAIRAFMDAVMSENAPFKRHAEDYVFCLLGEYDDHSGGFKNQSDGTVEVPEILMNATDALTIEGTIN